MTKDDLMKIRFFRDLERHHIATFVAVVAATDHARHVSIRIAKRWRRKRAGWNFRDRNAIPDCQK